MIIAEIGQNFEGDLKLAQKLIKLAYESGADLAKFQLFDSEVLYGEKIDTELTYEQANNLFGYGQYVGIEVFFSVFDVQRVEWCERIGVKYHKIAARVSDPEIFEAIEKTAKPIFASVDKNYPRILPNGCKKLYCISEYPAPVKFGDAQFGENKYYDGYSDHTYGLDACKIALAKGATIIEKHFSVSHDVGVDGAWSMTPEELRELKRFALVVEEI